MSLAAFAALMAAAPAAALARDVQPSPTGVYATLGYASVDLGLARIDAGELRLGYRFHRFVGVEGELALGLGDDSHTALAGGSNAFELKRAYSAYLVSFLPLSPKTDVLARIGYGETRTAIDVGSSTLRATNDSFRFGAGLQHHFDGRNGARVDYTRHQSHLNLRHADVWSIAFSRRF